MKPSNLTRFVIEDICACLVAEALAALAGCTTFCFRQQDRHQCRLKCFSGDTRPLPQSHCNLVRYHSLYRRSYSARQSSAGSSLIGTGFRQVMKPSNSTRFRVEDIYACVVAEALAALAGCKATYPQQQVRAWMRMDVHGCASAVLRMRYSGRVSLSYWKWKPPVCCAKQINTVMAGS